MKLLIVLEDLRTGGAQTFALRLAQALHIAGHQVHIYDQYAHLVNQELVRQLAPDVPVVSYGAASPGLDVVLRKAAGLGRRLGRPDWLREQQVIRHLRQTIQRLQPDVVNSHTIKADYVAAKALQGLSAPLVITMHGCYELFLHKADAPEVTPKGNFALQHAAAVVYLTAKNLEIFEQQGVRPLNKLLNRKIYNGFDGQFSAEKSQHTRATLGIPAEAKVFGMVARGIPEKGWAHAVNSFLALEAAHPELHLVLVGGSDYLTQLRAEHPHPRLHFTNVSRNPIDWVDLFDVGLLPSYFRAESLPNSIVEYLSCGKPVIATRIGEVPAMLAAAGGTAGMLVEQVNHQLLDPTQLTEAMRLYLTQPTLLAEHQDRASLAFDKFRMPYCLQQYEQVFRQVMTPSK
ncbi:glycosyltransferase family 4 protein [Hymenobacter canadensis]|uniref:Glycosyltransferase family 4 protein n=1 Tax=Hymenobacter canadensis TaxID=2999067 RepID=A0ABY7LNG3_9BACT|nr:glycosyltransferase family 4 protein [Hymenobacter canadensis]WBA41975.1 glycosyltransferase family 4 protein [Hymenobacter canadensis]